MFGVLYCVVSGFALVSLSFFSFFPLPPFRFFSFLFFCQDVRLVPSTSYNVRLPLTGKDTSWESSRSRASIPVSCPRHGWRGIMGASASGQERG